MSNTDPPLPSADHRERVLRAVQAAVVHFEAAGRPRVELPPHGLAVLQPGELLLVDDGFFHLQPLDGDAHTARAPVMAGLMEVSAGRPVPIHLHALEATRGYRFAPGELQQLCDQHEVFRTLRIALYEHELALMDREARAYRKHLHDFYAPGSAALLPGPYDADDVDLVGLLMQTEDPCWAKRLLPPGVWRPPGLRNNYLIVMAHFSNVSCRHPMAGKVTFDYRETTVFIPSVAGWRPGAYSPILFPDNAMAITLGREIYGFPKRFGRTKLDLAHRYAELEVDDKLEFWCKWSCAERVPTEDYVDCFVEQAFGERWWADKLGDVAGFFFRRLFEPDRDTNWPPMSVFVRKQLPDVALPCERELVYESDGLVRVPFDVSDVKHCELLHDLRFEPGPQASFLPASKCLLAGHAVLDMGFGVRQELGSYLGPLDHLDLMRRRVKRTTQRMAGRGRGSALLARDLAKDLACWIGDCGPSRQQKKPCKRDPQC